MPSLGVLILGHFQAFPIIPEVFTRVLLITFLGTYVLPGLLMLLLYTLGAISDLEIRRQNERSWPLLIAAFTFYAVYRILSSWPLAPEFIGFFAGMSIAVFIALILNRWIKISLHMIGIGGLTGLTIALNALLGVSEIWPLVATVIGAGLVGSSRLYLEAHQKSEVYLGFCVGLITILGAMMLA
jgi:membrane-associated phospholipid phosphatase